MCLGWRSALPVIDDRLQRRGQRGHRVRQADDTVLNPVQLGQRGALEFLARCCVLHLLGLDRDQALGQLERQFRGLLGGGSRADGASDLHLPPP